MTIGIVTCPGCGAEQPTTGQRDAASFCPTCDYPLFWAPTTPDPLGESSAPAGLHRLPGTGGHAEAAAFACPACSEPNPHDGTTCLRCGAALHPAPVVFVAEAPPPPPPAPPPPPPPPPEPVVWPWFVALGLVALVALVVAVLLLA